MHDYLAVIKPTADQRMRVTLYRGSGEDRIRMFNHRSVGYLFKDGPDAVIAELICHLLITVKDDSSLKIVTNNEELRKYLVKILNDDFHPGLSRGTAVNRSYIKRLKPLHQIIIEDENGNEIKYCQTNHI